MAVKVFTIDMWGGGSGPADETSADTAIYFKIYGSADSYTTAIATTGVHGTTGVSVSAGTATVTLEVGTETAFRVTQVDEAGNESLVSNTWDTATGDVTAPAAITDLVVTDNAAIGDENPELVAGGQNPYSVIADITANWVLQGLVGRDIVTFDGEAGVLSLPSASGHEVMKQAIPVEANTDYYIKCEVHTNNVSTNVRIFVHPNDMEGSTVLVTSGFLYVFSPTVQATWSKGYYKFNSGANTIITLSVASGGTTTGYFKNISLIKYN